MTSQVQNSDWTRMVAMMQVAKAKNPALTGGAAPVAKAQTSPSVERSAVLPANSPVAMKTYGSTSKPSSQFTGQIKGSKFDSYA